MHLSNTDRIIAMIVYSLITFIFTPYITRYIGLFEDYEGDQCIGGFLLGFTVSIILWMKYGSKL